MDKFAPQSGHKKEGHEESDISVRGILWFGAFLVIAGILSFVGLIGFMHGLEWWEKQNDAKLTPLEQQMQSQRSGEPAANAPAKKEEGAEPAPAWYGHGSAEERLAKTFPTPRLQYDDVRDLNLFRGDENKWLESTGKDAHGNIHIPVSRAMELLLRDGLPPVDGTFVSNPPVPVAGAVAATPAADTGKRTKSTSKSGAKK